MKMI
jgi:hypothetical protein